MQYTNCADFTIRIRFRIPAGHRIGVDVTKVALTPTEGPAVIFASADEDKQICESEWLVLQRSGWGSEEAANAAVEPLLDALRRSLARFHIGVDLGCRALHGGGFSQGAIMEMQQASGRTILNDVHGPIVFATHLRPMFCSGSGVGAWPPIPESRWKRAFLFALQWRVPLSDKERTASDLFNVARRVRDSRDAQFVLLFAAIETLIEHIPRPNAVLDHISQFVALTEEADLEPSEKVICLRGRFSTSTLIQSFKSLRRRRVCRRRRCPNVAGCTIPIDGGAAKAIALCME